MAAGCLLHRSQSQLLPRLLRQASQRPMVVFDPPASCAMASFSYSTSSGATGSSRRPTDHGKHVGQLSDNMLRTESLRVYRQIFRQARSLKSYDALCGSYVEWRARAMYRRREHETSAKKRKAHVKEARKHLSLLGKANSGHLHALGKVIAYSYGRRGRVKHLLQSRVAEIITSGGHSHSEPEGQETVLPKSNSKALERMNGFYCKELVIYCEEQACEMVAHMNANKDNNKSIDLFQFAQQHLEKTKQKTMVRRKKRLYEKTLRV